MNRAMTSAKTTMAKRAGEVAARASTKSRDPWRNRGTAFAHVSIVGCGGDDMVCGGSGNCGFRAFPGTVHSKAPDVVWAVGKRRSDADHSSGGRIA
ncbi:hypothetical protein GCM10009596_08160 [Arthrobacter rhombi]